MNKKTLLPFSSFFLVFTPLSNLINSRETVAFGMEPEIYNLATKYEQLNYKQGILNYNQMKTTIGFVDAGQLGIKEPDNMGLKTSLTVIKADEINMRVIVLFTICKSEYSNGFNEATGIITIYAKDSLLNKDLEEVEKIASKFIKIQKTKNQSFNIEGWNDNQEVTFKSLGIIEPEKKDSKIEYKIKKIDRESGELYVLVSVSKGLESVKFHIIVKGFNINEEDKKETNLDKVFKKIKDQQQSSKEQIDESWEVGKVVTFKDLGIKRVTLLGTKMVMKIKSIDLEKNIVIVNVTVTEGENSKTKDITISGFKNSIKDKDNDKEKDEEALKKNIDKISDLTTSKSDFLPSWNEGETVSAEDLGIENIEISDDVEIKFIVKNRTNEDKKNGNLPIKVVLTKNESTVEKDIIINGFQKESIEDENVNNENNENNENVTL